MCYYCKELNIYHCRSFYENYIPGEFYCIAYEDKEMNLMIESKDFEIKMIFNDKESKIKIVSSYVELNLPEKVHFGAILYELVK